jgi:hypothetical protein
MAKRAKEIERAMALNTLQAGASKLGVAMKNMRVLGMNVLDPNRLKKYIEKKILAMVKDALRKSYQQSGLKTDKGRIKRSIEAVEVRIVKGRLRIAMEGADAVLKQGASVNYGSIRNAKGLGKKARRTLKKAMLQNRALTERELRRYTVGVNQIHKGVAIEREALHGMSAEEARKALAGKLNARMSIGGTTIIKPHPFFFLSGADKNRINKRFKELYQAYLTGTLQMPEGG